MALSGWEYTAATLRPGRTDVLESMNSLGAEGWELVSSVATDPSWGADPGVLCIYKRPKLYIGSSSG